MQDTILCPHCGAPNDPTKDACRYCGAKRGSVTPSAGMASSGWDVQLVSGEIEWGPPIALALPANTNCMVALRSRTLLDDVHAEVAFRFEAGQPWASGVVSSALALAVRASSSAGYDVDVSIAGLISISRYDGRKLAEWLLEPCVHDQVKEGLGVRNVLAVTMQGAELVATINGTAIARVRDATRRAGAVEVQVRPGTAPARVVIDSLVVRGI